MSQRSGCTARRMGLEDRIAGYGRRHEFQKLVGDVWPIEHPAFEASSVLRAATFHHVRSQRPRSADEPQQATFVTGRSGEGLQRLPNKSVCGNKVIGVRDFSDTALLREPILQVRSKVTRHHGTTAADDVEVNSKCRERGEDV